MFGRIIRWLKEPDLFAQETRSGPRPRNTGEITLIGPPGHGKTTFVFALMGSLKRLGAVWSHWYFSLSPELDAKVRYQALEAASRRVPEPSGDEVESYSGHLSGLPRWGDRPLLLTELGYRSRLHDLNHRVASTAPVEMIFISPEELRVDPLERLDTVVASCLSPSGSRAASRFRSSKILVLTQADRCLWPAEIHAYLLGDPFRGLWPDPKSLTANGNTATYLRHLVCPGQSPAERLEQMAMQDARLKDWLASTPDGAAALEHFAAAGADLRICAVSALGSYPIGNKLLLPWRPRCVLDPLFWAFEMT